MKKLKTLPQERLAEIERFVDFVRHRACERRLVRAAMRAAEPAFATVWHDASDSAYDRL